jgi:hypothetical protein
MPNRTRIPVKLLVLAMLALPLPLVLLSQNLFAAEERKTPGPVAGQPQDLTAFLDSLSEQPSPGGDVFTPAPENKVVYCYYQSCPTGQRCWYCRSNWVCIYEYPDDPDRVPSGCTGGTQ